MRPVEPHQVTAVDAAGMELANYYLRKRLLHAVGRLLDRPVGYPSPHQRHPVRKVNIVVGRNDPEIAVGIEGLGLIAQTRQCRKVGWICGRVAI